MFAAIVLAAAATPVAALPTGPWVVSAEENLCTLQHRYTVDGRKVALVFQPLLDLPTMDVFVVGEDRSETQYQGMFTARISSRAEALTGRYYSNYATKSKLRYTRLTIGRGVLDDLQDGDTLSLQAKPINITLKVARPDKARAALAGCVTELKKSWGIDPAMADRVVTPLEGNPARYFDSHAYPPEALHQGIYGRVIALLNIGADGTVAHCRIVSSAGAALNDGTCKAAQRIRFKPARDKDGVALPATYLLPVRWVLPGAPPF